MKDEVRIILSFNEYEKILDILKKRNKSLYNSFKRGYEEYEERISTKRKATKRATERKIERVKEKIRYAVKELMKEGKNVNSYQIVKLSGISYNTAKKYKDFVKKLIEEFSRENNS